MFPLRTCHLASMSKLEHIIIKNYKIFDLALKLAKLTRKHSFDDQI